MSACACGFLQKCAAKLYIQHYATVQVYALEMKTIGMLLLHHINVI